MAKDDLLNAALDEIKPKDVERRQCAFAISQTLTATRLLIAAQARGDKQNIEIRKAARIAHEALQQLADALADKKEVQKWMKQIEAYEAPTKAPKLTTEHERMVVYAALDLLQKFSAEPVTAKLIGRLAGS